MLNKPSYIPKEFFEKTAWRLECYIEASNEFENDSLNIINKEKYILLSNLVGQNLHLQNFYNDNSKNLPLLLSVFSAFEHLPDWKNDFKTSGREDSLIIQKANKNVKLLIDYILASPDFRYNLQLFWEQYLKEEFIDKYSEVKVKRGSLLSLNSNLDLLNFFDNMSSYFEEIEPLALNKEQSVKKINSKDAYVHFIVRKLKRIFVEHSVNSRKQIGYIVDLVNGVLQEEQDVSEDRIRKLLT